MNKSIKNIVIDFLKENHIVKGNHYACTATLDRYLPSGYNYISTDLTLDKSILQNALKDFIAKDYYNEKDLTDIANRCANLITDGKDSIQSSDLHLKADKVYIKYYEEDDFIDATEEWKTRFIPSKLDVTIYGETYDFTNDFEDYYDSYEELVDDAEVILGIPKEEFNIEYGE